MKIQFKVTGMHCNSCKAMIEDIATDFPDITHCEVDFKSGLGSLECQDGFDINKFKVAIEEVDKYKLEFLAKST